MKCGREPGGHKESELGICPTTKLKKFDGVNRGRKSGRICKALVGTLCGGRIQGIYAEKITTCLSCMFYQLVCLQEGKGMQYAFLSRVCCRGSDTRLVIQGVSIYSLLDQKIKEFRYG